MANTRPHIVLGVTGSIAAYKSGDVIRRLQEAGCDVSVVMTKEAGQFITPLTLASLSGRKVYSSLLEDHEAWQMPHIRLAREAQCVLIAPATANVIGKIAAGIADDLLTCIVLATKAPILVAPAMNDEMYHNHIVQKNLRILKDELGVRIIKPIEGQLACGTFAEGHLAEVEVIVRETCSVIQR